MKTRGRKVTMFILTLVLAMGMIGSSVFAAPTSPVTENPKGEGDTTTSERMKQSNNTAHLTLDKTFEKFGTTWPNKNSFDYEISAVSFWDNSHVNTDENGTEKTRADMPVPHINGTALTAVSGKDYTWTANVPLGNEDGDGTTGADQDNKDSNVNSAKIGSKVVNFTFTRPGYYVYKVKEVIDDVAGVTYDEHTYHIAFYVANKTEGFAVDGDTQGGDVNEDGSKLYVHTITAWRSQTENGTNEQIFEQVVIPSSVDPSFKTSNKYFLKMKKGEEATYSIAQENSNKVYYKADNNGNLAKDSEGNVTAGTYENYDAIPDGAIYWVEVDQKTVDQMVARGEIGKVDRSKQREKDDGQDVGPNKLTINFWNETDNKDIEIVKKVTGTLGDLQKEFEFTVSLEGIEDDGEYEVTATGAKLDNGKVTGLKKDGEKYYVNVAANATTATFKVVLKANEKVKISGLPKGAKYTVTEASSDHVASYNITSTNLATDDTKAIIAKNTDANTSNGTALATAKETVDATDGGITITYTNHRDIETETGIPNFVWPIALAGILALIALAVIRRRKNVATVNDFEF